MLNPSDWYIEVLKTKTTMNSDNANQRKKKGEKGEKKTNQVFQSTPTTMSPVPQTNPDMAMGSRSRLGGIERRRSQSVKFGRGGLDFLFATLCGLGGKSC